MAFWLLPSSGIYAPSEHCYGYSEGLRLVVSTTNSGLSTYYVEDSMGTRLFDLPQLQQCLIDTGYCNGRLRFRELLTQRDGFIDRRGRINIINRDTIAVPREVKVQEIAGVERRSVDVPEIETAMHRSYTSAQELLAVAAENPFFKEAQKIVSGRLEESDADRRTIILNYCEHFRTAYTTRDIDFLRQVFSEKALIIVGTVVRTSSKSAKKLMDNERVQYNIRTKKEYLEKLQRVFDSNKSIDVQFDDFRIMRHPTNPHIYGVNLLQKYAADSYSDEGRLFLLWDFSDETMPVIHVRTWQPADDLEQETFSLEDFYLR